MPDTSTGRWAGVTIMITGSADPTNSNRDEEAVPKDLSLGKGQGALYRLEVDYRSFIRGGPLGTASALGVLAGCVL